jgi:NADP-dependent 3-hydroxy acid dehydrogenase YdfG
MSAGFPPHVARRVAVVSGASAGIGAAVAVRLAELGHPVALGARRRERCELLAEEIRAGGGEAVGLALDVTESDSVRHFAAQVRAELGEPEIVVSNAGTVVTKSVCEASVEQIEHDLDLNVLGAHRLITAFVPGMIERARGDVVFVSSDAVHAVRPGLAGYIAGKRGLEGLAAALRAELEGTGVRSSVVRVGPASTEISSGWDFTDFDALYEKWTKWGVQRHTGLLSAAQVAQAIAHVIAAPRGMHLELIEVQPEAPVQRAREHLLHRSGTPVPDVPS